MKYLCCCLFLRVYILHRTDIRIIANSNYTAHTAPLFNKLRIMPLKYLIKYTQSLLVHSIYHKYSLPSLNHTWITNGMRNENRELRNADDLYVPLARTEQVKKNASLCLAKNAE